MNPRTETILAGSLAPPVHDHFISGKKSAERWQRWLMALLRSSWQRWRLRPPRQLRLCETLALGERRFLMVVEFATQKFLIGCSGNAITVLTDLRREESQFRPSGLGQPGLGQPGLEEAGREARLQGEADREREAVGEGQVCGIRLAQGKDATE